MRNLQKPLLYRGWKVVWRGVALVALCASAVSGFAQPANDNFANAEVLPGAAGVVTNSNVGATVEIGEPNHVGSSGQKSIWYKWTAPADGVMSFNTFGSDFDTLLAVYVGDSVSALQSIVGNDDFDGSIIGPSGVKFLARAGVTYHIAVDGFGFGFFGDEGEVILTYSYSGSGIFQFTSPVFVCTELESSAPNLDVPLSRSSLPGVRVTVTRLFGNTGRVLIDYATANGSAIAGSDYFTRSGTLVFNDFEMSKSILIPIRRNFLSNEDSEFTVTLSNARLAPGENQNIPAPSINPGQETATVFIQNIDPGPDDIIPDEETAIFSIQRANYRVREDEVAPGGTFDVNVYVYRTGIGDGFSIDYRVISTPLIANNRRLNTFALDAGSDYATPTPHDPLPEGLSADFDVDTTGTLTWGQNDFDPQPITITITNDPLVEFNEDILIQLFFVPQQDEKRRLRVNQSILTILHDDLPAGSVDPNHNPDFNLNTVPPNNPNPGANNIVYAVAVQPDGRTLLGGAFQSVNTIGRNRVARLNQDGSHDNTFNPGTGANDFVSSLLIASGGKILIGGGFTSYNGNQRNGIARLNSNGSLDNTFDPGAGANLTVWAMAEQADGKVLIAGEFTSVNNSPRKHVARLNADGSLDVDFDPGLGPDGVVNAVVVQSDGKILIGGEFASVAGAVRGGIARLNEDGSLDDTFIPGTGADGAVYAVAATPGNRILIGGAFTAFDLRSRSGIARLNPDGSLDASFDPGTGANDTVYAITLQNDGKILIGGLFTEYNQTRRVGLARLEPHGPVDTTFLDTAYNHYAGLINLFDSDPENFVFSIALQNNGDVMIGGGFTRLGGGRFDPRIQPEGFIYETHTRAAYRVRKNVARLLGGATPGPGQIELAYDRYSIDENSSQLYVSIMRTNGSLGPISANFTVNELPPGPGAATNGVDYSANASSPNFVQSWPRTRMRSDGLYGPNFDTVTVIPGLSINDVRDDVYINIFDNNEPDGDRSAMLELSAPNGTDIFFLGGENIPLGTALGRSTAPMTIVDNDQEPGVLGFSSSNYTVNENGTNAIITVIRTNGSAGNVSVQFQTLNGTALAGSDFNATNGTLTFLNGQTTRSFVVRILDSSDVEPDETVILRLFHVTGGATLGLTNAALTIIDDDFPGGRVNFSAANYTTNENALTALISVTRSGSSAGTLTVQYATSDGTALHGQDYVGVTNTLTWVSGDTAPKIFPVTLLDDTVIEPDKTVNLRLSNSTLNGSPSASLGPLTDATLTIVSDDSRGQVGFSTAVYNANENGGAAVITVVRQGGLAESISVNFAALNGTAVGGFDFTPTNGILSFGPGEVSKSFAVVISDLDFPDTPRFISLQLSGATPGGTLGSQSSAIINIIDDETVNEPPGTPDTEFNPLAGFNGDVQALALQEDGKIVVGGDFGMANNLARNRIARLNPDGSLDLQFSASAVNAGANDVVRAIVSQSDGRVLVGGSFTTIDGSPRSRIARLNFNGSLDGTFNPGSGVNAPVFALAESFINSARKVLIGGAFTTFDGVSQGYVARLNDNGTLDVNFAPLLGGTGVAVHAIAVQPDGRILVAGEFESVSGIGRNRIARLNADGSLDLSFNPGAGAGDTVRALALQLDGRIVVGGSFTNFNGQAVNRITRLNADGSRDVTFTPGVGANDTVDAIVVQGDTRIVVGGQFTRCNGVTRNRLTRLNNDGTLDPSINFGIGANSFVAAVVVQPDDDRIVIGGGFTEYDGTARQRIARVYGRSLAGSGTLEFTRAVYEFSEAATNATVTVRRYGGTAGLTPGASVSVDAVTSDGTATNGIHYVGGTHTLVFPEGEVFQSFTVPVIDNFEMNPARTVNLTLGNIQPTGSASLGNQPTATLTILDDDSGISFSSATYSRNENSPDGQATITIVRTGSTTGPATVNFTTTTNGTATAGLDYLPVTNLVSFAIGETTRTVTIPIIDDLLIEGDETVTMELSGSIGGLLIAPSTATLTIVDDDIGPGQIAFAALSFAVAENAGNAIITLTRTNGSAGVVTVTFLTRDFTAVAGLDYTAVNTVITFGDGETVKTIPVPVLDDAVVEGNEVFHVTLTNATGGAIINEPATVPVTILDNDMGLSFSSPFYSVNESSPSVTLTVLRLGGSNGVATVRYDTTNLTATAGLDYTGVTNGLLTFAHGETLKTFTIPIHEDDLVEGDESFGVNLSNPSAGLQLLIRSTIVSILDNDTGFSLSTNSYVVAETATNVMITVFRTNANTGPASVSLTTSDETAIAGADYLAFGSSLNFTNGEAVKTILIPIINDTVVETDETFLVSLTGPSPGARILGVTQATVTIIDNDSGLQFSSANYTVPETGVATTITVLRTGVTTNNVAVNYEISDGTATLGLDYIATNGLLVFTNGELSKTFSIQIIDDTLEEGAETILLSLSSPTGQVSLLNPNAAILTIVDDDGGSILPAGTLLTAENGLQNGAIDPGERVTLLFALRNASGVDTTNLVATLLVTNGVTAPSAAQSYGALANNGASVSRPFTFTANGTNGGFVSATFQVQDGPSSYGRVSFVFLLGNRTTVFSNTAPITIVDLAPASPYPSSIAVTGLVGTITKVTATVTNLAHQSPDDIDMLLAGPTGATTMLMSDAGGFNSITNVTLTFDDAAANFLPDSTVISSGTNKPTNYILADVFPAPAPPAPWGATLAVFTNTNPNGLWSLYVVDDLQIMSGVINRGWRLAITTLGSIPAATDLSVRVTATPNPVVVGTDLTYSILVTNHGPWTATGVKLTNTIPGGAAFVSAVPSVGSIATNSGALVWTLGTMLKDAAASVTVVLRPNVAGPVITSTSVLGLESDPNPGNNLVLTTNAAITPIADLALDVVGSPNPFFFTANNTLTYFITVRNLGPAVATGVAVTNALPPEVAFLSATPSGYTVAGSVVTFTNLGNLASGAQTMATIVVRALTATTLTNDTSVGSVVTDPLKGNNFFSVKTLVEFPLVGFSRSGNNLVIAWPAGAATYALERTLSLTPPVVWTPVVTPAPVIVGDQKTVTLPIGGGSEFFRLREVGP